MRQRTHDTPMYCMYMMIESNLPMKQPAASSRLLRTLKLFDGIRASAAHRSPCGVVGCAASPSSTQRPNAQRCSGSRSKMALMKGSGVAAISAASAGENVSAARACMSATLPASAFTVTLCDLSGGSGWFTYLRRSQSLAVSSLHAPLVAPGTLGSLSSNSRLVRCLHAVQRLRCSWQPG